MGNTAEHNEVLRLLKEHGAVFERKRTHPCWRLPDGSTWVLPGTTSNYHAWKNNLADLKSKLGLNGVRGVPGERRPRRVKADRRKLIIYDRADTVPRDLKSQLKSLGPWGAGVPEQSAPEVTSPGVINGQPPLSMERPQSVWWKPWTWNLWR